MDVTHTCVDESDALESRSEEMPPICTDDETLSCWSCSDVSEDACYKSGSWEECDDVEVKLLNEQNYQNLNLNVYMQ